MVDATPPPGEYAIDPERSRIDFTAKHQFGFGTVHGRFAVAAGHVTIAERLGESSVWAAADAGSFSSGNRSTDTKILSGSFLAADKYPSIDFESTDAFQGPDDLWRLRGTLTARGIGAPVEFTVADMKTDGDDLVFSATATVDRYAHRITAMRGMAGRYLKLTAEIRARAEADGGPLT